MIMKAAMTKLKRGANLLLAGLLLFASYSMGASTTFAAITPTSTDDTWYTSVINNMGWNADIGCSLDQFSYCIRNCTSYTAARVSADGVSLSLIRGLGNGGEWYATAQNRGISVGSSPIVGAAAVIPANPQTLNDAGHVAYVTAVNPDGSINVMSYNGYTEKPFHENNTTRYSRFIYFAGSAPAPTSTVTVVSSQVTTPDGVEHVYAGTASGKVYDISWGNGAQLTQWQVANVGSSVTAISSQITSDGVQQVYVGTNDGKVHNISWGNGAPLVSWQVGALGSGVTSLTSQIAPNGAQHVYAGTASGKVYDISWGNGAQLTQWQVASYPNPIKALSSQYPSTGVQQVYAATGTTVQHISWGNGAPLVSWQVANHGGNISAISSQIINGVHNVYATVNGTVQSTSWGNGAPLVSWQVGNVGSMILSISSQVDVNGVQQVYVGTNDGKVHNISWGNGAPLVSWQVGAYGTSSITGLSTRIVNGVHNVYAATSSSVYAISWGNGTSLTSWKVGNL